MAAIKVTEQYAPRTLFMELGGFTSTDFTTFLRENGIEKDEETGCYPVFKVMAALNQARKKGRHGKDSDLDAELKKIKIQQIRIANAIKLQEYVPRKDVVDRMRTTFQAVSNQIRYSVKTASPRLVGVMNVRDIENIIIEYYNQAIEDLTKKAAVIMTWEDYGKINFQQGGGGMAEGPEEDFSFGSLKEDTF